MAFYGWLWRGCQALDVTLRCVGAVFLVRRWLAPWTCWTVRRALCWTRWALRSDDDASPGGTAAGRLQPSTCGCCGGVDFDGMAGRWAVVTGCTDGLGKEYALQLADRGMNVALVSRNRMKLQTVADDIRVRAQVFGGVGGRVRRRSAHRRPVPEHRVRGHQDEPDAVVDRGPGLDPGPGAVRAPLAARAGLPLRVPDAAERGQSSEGRRRRRHRGMADGFGERRLRLALLAVFGWPFGHHHHRFRHPHHHGAHDKCGHSFVR